MDFTYESYKKMLDTIIECGYKISDYHSYRSVEQPCILRHDVDMDLQKAAVFAKYESEIKGEERVYSTYFVLITSDFYNPFSKENIRFLKEILSYGHEIGLHFDEKKYMTEDNFDKEKIITCVEKEVLILSEILEQEVKAISMHRPSQEFLKSNIEFKGIINSYSNTFFNNFKYISDSRMCWREDVNAIVESKKEKALHILTHPFWYGKQNRLTEDILKEFLSNSSRQRYITLKDNFRNLEEFIEFDYINDAVEN